MKGIQTHMALMPMLEQLKENAKNEHLFKVRMQPNGDLRINGNQLVVNERIFNEFRGDEPEYDGLPHDSDCFWED